MTNYPWFDDGDYEVLKQSNTFPKNHSSSILCCHGFTAVSIYDVSTYMYPFIKYVKEVEEK